MDPFNLILSTVVFMVYGTICIISIIFTFSLELYQKIDEMLSMNILKTPTLTPLEINFISIDTWLMNNNKIVGPILLILAIFDLKLSFSIINLF